jgi:hypothetical protein
MCLNVRQRGRGKLLKCPPQPALKRRIKRTKWSRLKSINAEDNLNVLIAYHDPS